MGCSLVKFNGRMFSFVLSVKLLIQISSFILSILYVLNIYLDICLS